MSGPTFILDGSNLAWLGPGDGPALAPVDAIADTLRAEWPDCKVIAVCDASLRHRLDANDKAEHRRRTDDGRLVEAPADEDADAYILDAARRLGGCVVTRDLYRDRREGRAGIPMLRPALIGGAVILGDPKVFETADADRASPLAPGALGERIAPPPLPGGPVDPLEIAREKAADGDEDGVVVDDAAVADDAPSDETPPLAEAPAPTPKPRRRRKRAETVDEPTTDAPSEDADAEQTADEVDDASTADPAVTPKPKPKPKAKKPTARKTPKKAAARSASSSRRPKSKASSRGKAEAHPPLDGHTALGAAILLALVGALGALGWWIFADDTPPPEPEAGVLFVRNCQVWRLAEGQQDIVFHARPDTCVASAGALGPDRFVMVLAEGSAPATTGAVRLAIAGEGRVQSTVELTRGRPAVDDRPAELATARIAAVVGDRVALAVSPNASEPALHILRAVGGDVLAHTASAAGVALAGERAAVLRNRCPAGCGTAHLAPGLPEAIMAADAPVDAPTDGPRWAGPAAFSPDGVRLAAALAFDGQRGGVVIIDAEGAQRTIPFTAREAGTVDGLAWVEDGLYLSAVDAVYRIDPDGDAPWQPVIAKAGRVAPGR